MYHVQASLAVNSGSAVFTQHFHDTEFRSPSVDVLGSRFSVFELFEKKRT